MRGGVKVVEFIGWVPDALPDAAARVYGDEGNAGQPELQGLPVDACDDAGGEQRVAPQRAAQRGGRDGLQLAADAGAKQGALRVVVVDAHHSAIAPGREQEPEAVAALDPAERRHVEGLPGLQFAAPRRVVQHVAMTFTESVVHLHDDRAQRAVDAVAVPEAHRLEGVAEHARKAVQPRFAIGIGDAVLRQQPVEPLHGVRAAVAMVGVMEAERAASVVGERQGGIAASDAWCAGAATGNRSGRRRRARTGRSRVWRTVPKPISGLFTRTPPTATGLRSAGA